MVNPTEKSLQVEATLKALFGFDRGESITNNSCIPAPIGCGQKNLVFTAEKYIKEYRISGMCEKCQKEFFEGNDDDEV